LRVYYVEIYPLKEPLQHLIGTLINVFEPTDWTCIAGPRSVKIGFDTSGDLSLGEIKETIEKAGGQVFNMAAKPNKSIE